MKVYFFPEDPAPGVYAHLITDLLESPTIHTGEWQAMDTSKSAVHTTHEMEDVSLVWERIPQTAGAIYNILPAVDGGWAAEHFEERVSGIPLNPAPSHVRWPYAVRSNADHTNGATFDHTYPERFWPKQANQGPDVGGRVATNQGIRFHYGDLSDVVDLLVRSPLTRQAYLPVWFPEDTGAVDGQRVPCTLGYHFMQRGGRLSCRYYIRSCDAYRHLSNDVFLAAALTTWVANQVTTRSERAMHFRPGGLTMHISSLHSFVGDTPKLNARVEEATRD